VYNRARNLPCSRLLTLPYRLRLPSTSLTSSEDMAALSAVIYQHLALRQAACGYILLPALPSRFANAAMCSFAFVEYESLRDSDDAYHEMHNKRIGRDRDEVLKIEARLPCLFLGIAGVIANPSIVGPYSPFCFLALRDWP
jgi:hypothetical protein